MLTDGPHGLRKQRSRGDSLGVGDSVPATCFPAAVGLGSSWDAELVERIGAAVGVEDGEYTIDVAASSRDIRTSVNVKVAGDEVRLPLTRASSIGEVLAHPVAGPLVQAAVASMTNDVDGANAIMPEGVAISRMLESLPIGKVGMFAAASGMDADAAMIDALLDRDPRRHQPERGRSGVTGQSVERQPHLRPSPQDRHGGPARRPRRSPQHHPHADDRRSGPTRSRQPPSTHRHPPDSPPDDDAAARSGDQRMNDFADAAGEPLDQHDHALV
jgi:hypothetical protein